MKAFEELRVDLVPCREQLSEFGRLLEDPGRPSLKEKRDVLPFFRGRKHLSAWIGHVYNPKITAPDRLAHEFDIFGDYRCDLVIGDSATRQYCFVEFEDASPGSVFTRRTRATPQWSSRFDRGYSQIIDWFLILDDVERSRRFKARFGADAIGYVGLLVIGRRHFLDDVQFERLRWRRDRVVVNSHHVNCITYDELYEDLSSALDRLALYALAAEKDRTAP